MTIIHEFINGLIDLLKAMSPYLLLGFFFAGVLKVWFPQKWINRYMGKSSWSSVVNTAILGIPLPLCSCGVIPTGISFYRNGASKGSSVSFLISTPQTGVDSLMVTYSLLGLPFAIIRIIVALITGVIGGGLTNVVAKKDEVNAAQAGVACESKRIKSKSGLFRVFHYGFYEFLMDIAKWLVIGLIIAGILAVLIPDDFFTQYLDNEPLSMLMVLIASVPLYLCATASVPIAAVLMLKGLSPGAALVLLMAGPATNAATITVIRKVFGSKTLFSYLGSIIAGALLFGVLINTFLPREWFTLSDQALHHAHRHELLPEWFQVASAILLIALIINGYIRNYQKRRKANKEAQSPKSVLFKPLANSETPSFKAPTLSNLTFSAPASLTTIVIRVEGMTCSHCKASVEKNLMNLKNIEIVTADPKTNRVAIDATSIDLQKIEQTVESLGYHYKGIIS